MRWWISAHPCGRSRRESRGGRDGRRLALHLCKVFFLPARLDAFADCRSSDFTMRRSSHVRHAAILLMVMASVAGAQLRTGSLDGTIRAAGSREPVAAADVTLVRDTSVGAPARRVRTAIDGRFSFPDLPPGPYRILVRRTGLDPVERGVVVPRDVAMRVDLELTSGSGARNWHCRANVEETRKVAKRMFAAFVVTPATGVRSNARAYGLPADSAQFFRQFRPVADRAECHRIAGAIDQQVSLAEDRVIAFQIGKVYYFPEFGDGGMFTDLSGKILAIYIVPG
jgi:Carboxypeptidase regulatory-like domain